MGFVPVWSSENRPTLSSASATPTEKLIMDKITLLGLRQNGWSVQSVIWHMSQWCKRLAFLSQVQTWIRLWTPPFFATLIFSPGSWNCSQYFSINVVSRNDADRGTRLFPHRLLPLWQFTLLNQWYVNRESVTMAAISDNQAEWRQSFCLLNHHQGLKLTFWSTSHCGR